MKPFLILQIRPRPAVVDNEFEAILKYGGLTEEEVVRIQLEHEDVPNINFDDISGIFFGGGPSTYSDAEEKKSEAQRRYERQAEPLMQAIMESDFPYFGLCYGMSMINTFNGGIVNKENYSEDVGPTTVTLNEEGLKDPICQGLERSFKTITGHKEACQTLAPGGVVLAGNDDCPYEIVRWKNNVYGIQFHPELDMEGMELRTHAYLNEGYFPPEYGKTLLKKCYDAEITPPSALVKNFVDRYRKK